MVISGDGRAPDAMAAGARIAPPSVVGLQWRVSVQLGGVLEAESREAAHEAAHVAVEALAQTLGGFVDLESAVSVSALPRGA